MKIGRTEVRNRTRSASVCGVGVGVSLIFAGYGRGQGRGWLQYNWNVLPINRQLKICNPVSQVTWCLYFGGNAASIVSHVGHPGGLFFETSRRRNDELSRKIHTPRYTHRMTRPHSCSRPTPALLRTWNRFNTAASAKSKDQLGPGYGSTKLLEYS